MKEARERGGPRETVHVRYAVVDSFLYTYPIQRRRGFSFRRRTSSVRSELVPHDPGQDGFVRDDFSAARAETRTRSRVARRGLHHQPVFRGQVLIRRRVHLFRGRRRGARARVRRRQGQGAARAEPRQGRVLRGDLREAPRGNAGARWIPDVLCFLRFQKADQQRKQKQQQFDKMHS